MLFNRCVMKKLNFNSIVKVKLTPFGADIFYHKYDELIKEHPKLADTMKPKMPQIDKEGFTEFQLWHFIELYGNYIGMCKKSVVEDINFYINEDDLDDLKV